MKHPEFFTTDCDIYEVFGTILTIGQQRNRYQKVDESTRRQYRRELPTLDEHFRLLRRHPDATLAFVCGPGSGICSLECAISATDELEKLTGEPLRTPTFESNDGASLIMLMRYPDFDIPQTIQCGEHVRLLGLSGLVELPAWRGRELDCDQWIYTVDDIPFADVPGQLLEFGRPLRPEVSDDGHAIDTFLADQYDVDLQACCGKADCYAILKTWCARAGVTTPTWPEFQARLKELNVHDLDDARLLFGLRRKFTHRN